MREQPARRPGDESASTALARAVKELSAEEREVLKERWALSHQHKSDEEIAERLGLHIEAMWRIHDRALQTLGFLWVTGTSPGVGWLEAEAA